MIAFTTHSCLGPIVLRKRQVIPTGVTGIFEILVIHKACDFCESCTFLGFLF